HCQRDIAIYHQIPTAKEIKFINASLDKLMLYARINNPVAKIDYPFWAYLQDHLLMPLIYDCMDDYEGFDITGKHILQLEKGLVKKADLTLVCSNILMSKILKLKPIRSVLIKNAGDYEHFAAAEKITCKIPSDLPTKKRKIIGFFGAVGEWIDAVLLREIAERYKDMGIVIIGQIQNKEITALQNLPNMWFLGEKPYNKLPDYLQWFDVCIIPFKISRHTTLIDPVKLYEYFASGKPVVTTAVAEIKHFKNLLYYSDSRKKFLDNVQTALQEKNSGLRKKRQEAAKNNTWDKRAKLLHAWIQKLT
ncbi:MAG: glycosyltransferase, partial [Patescibacteria group bacterium]